METEIAITMILFVAQQGCQKHIKNSYELVEEEPKNLVKA